MIGIDRFDLKTRCLLEDKSMVFIMQEVTMGSWMEGDASALQGSAVEGDALPNSNEDALG